MKGMDNVFEDFEALMSTLLVGDNNVEDLIVQEKVRFHVRVKGIEKVVLSKNSIQVYVLENFKNELTVNFIETDPTSLGIVTVLVGPSVPKNVAKEIFGNTFNHNNIVKDIGIVRTIDNKRVENGV